RQVFPETLVGLFELRRWDRLGLLDPFFGIGLPVPGVNPEPAAIGDGGTVPALGQTGGIAVHLRWPLGEQRQAVIGPPGAGGMGHAPGRLEKRWRSRAFRRLLLVHFHPEEVVTQRNRAVDQRPTDTA